MRKLLGKQFLLFYTLLLFIMISCSKDDEIIENDNINNEVINSLVELKIDGKSYEVINNTLGFTLLGTYYQGNASFSVKNGNTPEFYYNMNYQFTEGGALMFFELEETKYTDGANILKKFKTPSYKPLNSFQIDKFEIDQEGKKIIIEFTGVLNSVNNSTENKYIEGKIIQNYGIVPPWGRDYCYLKTKSGTLDFLSSFYEVWNNGVGNQNIDFVSGNGNYISIQLNQPLLNFSNITFDENSTINKVVFKKALAPYFVNDSSLGIGSQQQWEEYKTSGSLTVTNIYNGSKPGGGIHINGIINLTIKDLNNSVIDILELEFVVNN